MPWHAFLALDALLANEDGTYDALLEYMRKHRRL
jgi:hypothetical protein